MQPKLAGDVPTAQAVVVELVRVACPHCRAEHLHELPVDGDSRVRRCERLPRLLYRLPKLAMATGTRTHRPVRDPTDPIAVAHAAGLRTADVCAALKCTPSWLGRLVTTAPGAARVLAAVEALIDEREEQEQEE